MPPEIRAQRQDAWGMRYALCLELKLDPSKKAFYIAHNVSQDVPSRWLTDKLRGVAPGSVQDVNMWRWVRADIAKYAAILAKRHGAVEISNSAPRSSRSMTA